MTHIMIFFLVISLSLGIGSITVTTQQYNLYRLGFLKYLIIFLISVNVSVVFSIFYNYFQANLSDLPYQYISVVVEIIYRLTASLLLFVIFGSMIYILRDLINQKPSAKYLKSLVLFWLLLIILFFFGLSTMFEKNTYPIPIMVNVFIDQVGQYLIIFEITRSYYFTATLSDSHKRTNIRKLLTVIGLMWLSIISLTVLRLTGIISNSAMDVGSSLLIILINVLPMIFLKQYLRRTYGVIDEQAISIKSYENSEDLFKRHEITPREQDIIRLICQGCPNKIIADRLCISIHTVKDHNSRIFKKLAVTNRVQLTNMFKYL